MSEFGAFLGGSYARGAADVYSDLDLYVITADGAYKDFFAERAAFVRQLGEPVFLEDFDEYGFDLMLFMFSRRNGGRAGAWARGRLPAHPWRSPRGPAGQEGDPGRNHVSLRSTRCLRSRWSGYAAW